MAGPAAILREIHRLRKHARDLQTQLERAPLAIKVQHNKATHREDALREAQEALKKMKVSNHEKEVTLRTKMQQIAKHQKQLNESGSKKEYDALQAELAAEKKLCQELEDEILTGLMEIEERTAALPELEGAVRRAKDEAGQYERESKSREEELRGQLAEVNRNLEQVEATLPADVRQLYDRLTSARAEDAFALIEGRTCTACYTEITRQSYNELLQERVVVCKTCGRFLYLPERTLAAEPEAS